MTRLPTLATDDLLSAARGECCFSCREPLRPALGTPCLCPHCWRRTPADERKGLVKADRNAEQGVQAGKIASRRKRDRPK